MGVLSVWICTTCMPVPVEARAASDQPRAAVMDGCEPSHGAVHTAQVLGESIPSSEPLSHVPSSNPVTL